MLSLRAVILLFYLFFKLGSLMPGKHLLVETEDGGEVGIPDGTLQTPSHPGIVKNRVVCVHAVFCVPTRECRCGGPCGHQRICDDKAEEELMAK